MVVRLIIKTLKAIRSPIKKTRLWATEKLKSLIKYGKERAEKTGELGEYHAWYFFGQDVLAHNLTPVFPENVQGLVNPEDLEVPHSELAIHMNIAGKPLVAWAFTQNRAHAVVKRGPGDFTYVQGGLYEVLTPNLVRKSEFVMGKPAPLGVPEAVAAGVVAGATAGVTSSIVSSHLRKRSETGELGPGVRFHYHDIARVEDRGRRVILNDGTRYDFNELNAAERAMVTKYIFEHGGLSNGKSGKHPAIVLLEKAISEGWSRDVSSGFVSDEIIDVDDTNVYLEGGTSFPLSELNRRELEEVVKVISR